MFYSRGLPQLWCPTYFSGTAILWHLGPTNKLFPKPIFFGAVELPSQSRSLLTQAGAINKYMHTSKKMVPRFPESADNFEFSAERLSENAKSFKITIMFSHYCLNKRIKRNFVAKFVVRIYALFPQICLDWKNRILQTLSFFGCMIILCSYMLIANCRRFNWTCKKHTKPPRICSHRPTALNQGGRVYKQ